VPRRLHRTCARSATASATLYQLTSGMAGARSLQPLGDRQLFNRGEALWSTSTPTTPPARGHVAYSARRSEPAAANADRKRRRL